MLERAATMHEQTLSAWIRMVLVEAAELELLQIHASSCEDMKVEKPTAHAGEEITLKLDGALITPEDFKKAVHAFIELLLTVTEEISKGGKRPLWNMSVREGGAILVARAVPDVETRKTARGARKEVKSTVAKIERGKFDFAELAPRTLSAVRELASLPAKLNHEGISKVTIGTGEGKAAPLTTKTADFLKKNLGAQRSAHGSIEGKLSVISERGTFQFVVFDSLADRGINCFVPEVKFREADDAFGERVSVFGLIQYDRENRPLSIKVESIRAFKNLYELPPIEAFLGVLKSA